MPTRSWDQFYQKCIARLETLLKAGFNCHDQWEAAHRALRDSTAGSTDSLSPWDRTYLADYCGVPLPVFVPLLVFAPSKKYDQTIKLDESVFNQEDKKMANFSARVSVENTLENARTQLSNLKGRARDSRINIERETHSLKEYEAEAKRVEAQVDALEETLTTGNSPRPSPSHSPMFLNPPSHRRFLRRQERTLTSIVYEESEGAASALLAAMPATEAEVAEKIEAEEAKIEREAQKDHGRKSPARLLEKLRSAEKRLGEIRHAFLTANHNNQTLSHAYNAKLLELDALADGVNKYHAEAVKLKPELDALRNKVNGISEALAAGSPYKPEDFDLEPGAPSPQE